MELQNRKADNLSHAVILSRQLYSCQLGLGLIKPSNLTRCTLPPWTPMTHTCTKQEFSLLCLHATIVKKITKRQNTALKHFIILYYKITVTHKSKAIKSAT